MGILGEAQHGQSEVGTHAASTFLHGRPRRSRSLTEGWVLGEALHTHRLARNHLHDGRIARFQGLGVVLQLLAGAPVDLLLQLGELAGDVCGVAVDDGRVAGADLPGVVQDDHLGDTAASGSLPKGSFLQGLALPGTSRVGKSMTSHATHRKANWFNGRTLSLFKTPFML